VKKQLKIVLTTDFTDSSHHAMDYAKKLFSKWQGEISYFLLHGYMPMVPYSGGSGGIPVIKNDAYQKESIQKLNDEAEILITKAKMKVIPVFEKGPISEALKVIEKREKPDLVIIGSRERSFIERMTFGSNTIQVLNNSNTPIMAIPLKAKFKKPTSIMFAADFKTIDIPIESFDIFKDLVKLFKAKLQVLHIYESEEEKQENLTLTNSDIHNYLKDLEHEHCYVVNEDVDEGISSFIAEHKPEMLAMIPHDQGFFEQLFKTSLSRKMTQEANLPLLILK